MGWHIKRHWYSFMVTLPFQTFRSVTIPCVYNFPQGWYCILFLDTFIDCTLEVRSGLGTIFLTPAACTSSPHPLVCNKTSSSLAYWHIASTITITSPNHIFTCTLACHAASFLKLASACPHLTLHSSLSTMTSLILPLSCSFKDSGNCIYSSFPVFCCFAFLSSASSNLLKLILLRILIISIVTN